VITVTRIIGESYDFGTGKETPKAIVLSNGLSEVAVAVDEETLAQVIALYVEAEQQDHIHTSEDGRVPEVDPYHEPPPSIQTPDDEPQVPPSFDDIEQEVGPEYNDLSSGVESI